MYIGECTEHLDYLPAPAVFTDVEECGGNVYFKFRSDSKKMLYNIGDEMYIGFSDRLNGVFFSEWCENLCFSDITVYNGTGMGFLTQVCKDITFDRIKVCPIEGR